MPSGEGGDRSDGSAEPIRKWTEVTKAAGWARHPLHPARGCSLCRNRLPPRGSRRCGDCPDKPPGGPLLQRVADHAFAERQLFP
jgi:hypothetical protein